MNHGSELIQLAYIVAVFVTVGGGALLFARRAH